MYNPDISIVLPVYNASDYVARAIDSILNQTIGNWELIIIDDGSTDNSGDICLGYSDERIKYIYQDNHGAGVARFRGIQESKGDYIAFIDSDDYYTPDALKLFMDEISTKNVDLVVGQHERYRVDGRQVKQCTYSIGVFEYSSNPDRASMQFLNCFCNAQYGVELWNKLFRADLLKKSIPRPINLMYAEDAFMFAAYMANIKSIACFGNITYRYEYRDNSLARSSKNVQLLPYFAEAVQRQADIMCKKFLNESSYAIFAANMFNIALTRYAGSNLQTKANLQNQILDLGKNSYIHGLAHCFVNDSKKIILTGGIAVDQHLYLSMRLFMKSIYKHDSWYYIKLLPALFEKRRTVFVAKAYIKRIIYGRRNNS